MSNINFSNNLVFDPSMSLKERYERCLYIIDKYRGELPYLRRRLGIITKQKEKAEELITYWREKYEEEKEKSKTFKREVDKLKKEIEKISKTNNRYQIALFDHGNFKSPIKEKNKKPKGGQIGHVDTNREKEEDYDNYEKKRLFAKSCGKCGHDLPRTTSIRQKILMDIVINPKIVKLVLESERQWCSQCKMEVYARDSRSLPFTEYGINTVMMILILRFKCHSSLRNISTLIELSYGLKISKSNIVNLLNQTKTYLKSYYKKLIKKVRSGKVMYNDETGWLVNGESAWMWIMANKNTTVYFAAESRGKGIAEEMYGLSHAYSMHDGLASYQNTIPKDKTCYCWAHILRYAFEETVLAEKYSTIFKFRQKLVDIYHVARDKKNKLTKHELAFFIKKKLESLINQKSNITAIKNIQKRLKNQLIGLIAALVETKDGTNNLAERELRPMVINKRISYGSNTFSGMESTAVLGSVIQTLSKKEDKFLLNLKNYLLTGVKEKYSQYKNTVYFDSS